MTFFRALVIGIVQGLTEFLPISSTAHIRIVAALFDWGDPGAAFTAVIQWGTLVAVMLYFRRDIIHLTRAVLTETFAGKFCASRDATMGWMIAVGTVPVVVCGMLFKKHIENTLRSLYVISGSLIVFALLLMLAEWFTYWRQKTLQKQKSLDDIGWADALLVGCAQAVALIPGASRSGVTITGGLFLGLTRETAARFSFLLSLPAVFGAGLYELYKERHELLQSQEHVTSLVVATVVSGIVGYGTIAFLLGYLKKHTTYVFIIYRLIAGGLLLLLLFQGRLQPLPEEKETQVDPQAREWMHYPSLPLHQIFWPNVADDYVYQVTQGRVDEANDILWSCPIVPVSDEELEVFSDGHLSKGSGLPYLVRGARIERTHGAFSVRARGKWLWVSYSCLGRDYGSLVRQPLVVLLKSRPENLYVEASMAE